MTSLFENVFSKLGLSNEGVTKEVSTVTEASIKDWMINRISKALKIDPSLINTGKEFESYGLDSMQAIKLTSGLEKYIEIRLSPALLFEYSTIDSLAKHLITLTSSTKN
ncbi:acyl carrier protein [Reinekea sp.]|jgi:acyl carrier protein|uniref:acyl carrier protein n=1 Tax=Reinekea sp. TaxID=1970455 RepID=UPI002A81CE69|nr:acyl carrier protein [Reinekea sp.]